MIKKRILSPSLESIGRYGISGLNGSVCSFSLDSSEIWTFDRVSSSMSSSL